MHKFKLFSFFIIVFALFGEASAQNVINSGVVTLQNFNSMGSSPTASLPIGWRVSIAGGASTATYAASPLTAVTQAANSGSPSAQGVYNWGTTAGVDRSLGFLTGPSYPMPNAIIAQYTNNTGGTITTTTIAFSLERYAVATRAFSLSFFYSTDDITYTGVPAGNVSTSVFATGSISYDFVPGQTATITATIAGLNIPASANIYFKWVFTASDNSVMSQGIGLDDVAVSSGFTTISATLTSTLTTDAPPTGKPNPGDVIEYKTTITNNGSDAARNLQVNQPAPPNTTLTGAVRTSAIANDDNYITPLNTPLTATTVLANDYGLPSVSLIAFGTTTPNTVPNGVNSAATTQGGSVIMNADGTFTYTPPNPTFTGYDTFVYSAGTGTLPNNDAIVTIAVGTPATANPDNYPNAIGNLTITDNVLTNDAGSGTLNVTAVNGSGGNVGNPTATAHGTVTVNSNGSFTYNPNGGYTGNDQFTYTITNAFNIPSTGTVNITLSNMIWFVNNAVAVSGTGTQASPFKQTSNVTGTSAGDNIFFYESVNPYTGSITLLNNQKLIGQDASNDIPTITGLTIPSYSSVPSMNATAGQTVSLTASNANIVTLANGNTIRGLTLSSAGTGFKLVGNSFGTLTIGNSITPDVAMVGTGGTMSLTTGTFSASSGLMGIQSSSSSAQGLHLAGITNSGVMNFGVTTISGSTTQGILIGTTNADLNFGNTIVSGGTDGLSFQNNSNSGHPFIFGTLSATGGSGSAFLHGAGGGNVSVQGNATLSSGTADVVDISDVGSGTLINFSGSVSVTKTVAGGEGIHWSGTNTNATLTFNSLSVQTNLATGMNLSGGGTVNVISNISNVINITTQAAPAIIANGIALNANFFSINSSGGTNGVSLTNVTGLSNFGGGALSGSSGATFFVSGQNGTFSYTGTISQSNSARAVDIQNKTGGIVDLSGSVSGTTNSTGINFANNASATLNLTGGVTLDGTASVFSATNGGTVNITGSSNTIGNTTAPTTTAFNMSGSAIGASGITFQKISCSSATANSINLINASSGGFFSITGTGTTAGSGGTLNQNSAAASDGSTTDGTGIYITNTSNISLFNMNFTGTFGNFGIRGDGVDNFTLRRSNLTGTFGTNGVIPTDEGTIRFGTENATTNGLTGVALFAGNNIANGVKNNVSIFNGGAGTLSITFQDDGAIQGVIGNTQSVTTGNNGIQIQTAGTGNGSQGSGFNLNFTVTDMTFPGTKADAIFVEAKQATTQNITVQNTQFSNNMVSPLGGGVNVNSSAASDTKYIATYNITNCTFTGAVTSPIVAYYKGVTGTINGVIYGNTIGTPGNGTYDGANQSLRGASQGDGMIIALEKNPGTSTLQYAVRIENNQIADLVQSNGGITFRSNNTSGNTEVLEATIKNNTVKQLGTQVLSAVYAQIGGTGASDIGILGLDLHNNVFDVSGTQALGVIDLDQITSTSHYDFPGYTGSVNGEGNGGTASTDLATFLENGAHLNTFTLGASGAVKVFGSQAQNITNNAFTLPVPLMVFAPAYQLKNFTGDNIVTADKLKALTNAAIQRWADAGATKEQIATMHSVSLNIENMLGVFIGSSSIGKVNVDNDGAGYGWFIDSTPLDDNEFTELDNAANKNSTAYGKIDLLTVLMHELGHQAGIEDDYVPSDAHSLMYGYIKPGERRIPVRQQQKNLKPKEL